MICVSDSDIYDVVGGVSGPESTQEDVTLIIFSGARIAGTVG
jgi:hypothetical protein